MKRMQFQHRDCFRRALAIVIVAGVAGVGNTGAGEDFRLAKSIDGFSALATTRNMEAVSISDAESAGAGGPRKLAWGQAMLEELERMQKTAGAGNLARTEDVFAFRDWCIGAPGRGNLLLAIAAEETVATQLFRALAEDQTCGKEVQRRFARCLPNGLTANYWLETLAMEGIVVDCGDALKVSEPEYYRMGIVLETLDAMLGHSFKIPKPGGIWNGCTDAFEPGQLVFRTMLVAQKEIALEVCLDILDGAGTIPGDRSAFIEVAEKYAAETLRKRDRFTSWTTAIDVWDSWAAVLADVHTPSEP